MVKYRFESGTGERIQGWEAVLPLLRVDMPRRLTCIGTGFYIHTGGILVTAAHVVRDLIGEDGTPTAGLAALQYVPPNQMMFRPIVKASIHAVADVAVLGVKTRYHKENGDPVRNRVMALTGRLPLAGDLVSTWAFPKPTHEQSDSGPRKISILAKLYDGEVRKEYPNGRDKVVLPGRCYETSLAIEGGASGGPVFDESGTVFAVNSTGFDGTDIGYVSHIQSIGELSIASFLTKDGELLKAVTIKSLIEQDEILVEHINLPPAAQ